LRQWSFENFYHELDNEIQKETIYGDFKKVYPKLENRLGEMGYDVFLAMALMTDSELRKISQTLKKDERKFFAHNYFQGFGFYEIISSLPKDSKIDIYNAGLDKSKFFRFEAF
jgi:hypothetical protein